MNSIHFHEKQRFNLPPINITIGLVQVLFLWGLIQQVLMGEPWGPKPASDSALIVINSLIFLFFVFFISIKLDLEITDKYMSHRMLPLQIRMRIISWNEVRNVSIIKFDGIKDYWGYGIRYMPRKGWCYTLPSNYGLKVTMENGKQLLIGTNKPKELYQIVKSLNEKGILSDQKSLN